MTKGGNSSWLVIEELLERGDPAFVDELRGFDDADRLGQFAGKWFADRSPLARRFLFEYLDRPLNAYRHEPLVKRLFKLAEAAGDDAVMARFLVLFDRSIRRSKKRTYHFESQTLDRRDAAQALVDKWNTEGADNVSINQWDGRYYVYARWAVESARIRRGSRMPRGTERTVADPWTGKRHTVTDLMSRLGLRGRPPKSLKDLPEKLRKKLEGCRLFSVHTRHYLRRRAWRYFRKLGKFQPERYIPAVVQVLIRYRDADVPDGLALLDNWGLMHVLFHHSPALVAKTNGWVLAPEHTLAELAPAPAFEWLWKKAPAALLELLREARCRTVRQWAIHFLRREGKETLAALSPNDLLALLCHPDAEVASLAAEALPLMPDLESVSLDRWLALLDQANASALERLCELMLKHLQPEKLTLEHTIELACRRPVPVARLGLSWLRNKAPADEAGCKLLLRLTEAEAEPVRGEAVSWARQVLGRSADFQADWVLHFLDCRHYNVRAEGWGWLLEEARARDNVMLWQRLLESPYDDVRLKLVAELERRVAGRSAPLPDHVALDPELVRLLWASVLLNIHRGNRAKPVVVGQLVRRLGQKPEDAPALLPILSVALRSIRGPEWRAGLAGLVQLLERNPDLEPLVRGTFPEFRFAV